MDHPEENRFTAAVDRYRETEDAVAVAAYVGVVAGRSTKQSRQHDISIHTTLHAAEGTRLGALRLRHGANETLNFCLDDAELACKVAAAINRELAVHAAGARSAPMLALDQAPAVRAA